MQTPLERAARALCELHIRNVRRHDTQLTELEKLLPGAVDYAWKDFLPEARAVLEAIREPSEAMIEAGSAGGDWPHSKESWQAMLDTAIKGE